MPGGVVGRQLQGAAITGYGFVVFPQGHQRIAQSAVRCGELWPPIEKLTIASGGLLPMPLSHERVAEVAVIFRHIGLNQQGAAQVFDCEIETIILQSKHAEKMQGAVVIWILTENLTIKHFSLRELTPLVLAERSPHESVDVAWGYVRSHFFGPACVPSPYFSTVRVFML